MRGALGRRTARLAAPAAFLAAATVAVLLVRSALHADRGEPARVPPATATVRAPATTTPRPQRRRDAARYHRIEAGDTLATIATRYDTTVGRLLALNPGLDPVALRVGQRIRVR